jgi:hypothetical protein
MRCGGRPSARVEIRGFNDMSVDEVASECHMSLLQARLAKLRDYSECFRIRDPLPEARERLLTALVATRLRCLQGDRYH